VSSDLHPLRIELKPRPSDNDNYQPSEGKRILRNAKGELEVMDEQLIKYLVMQLNFLHRSAAAFDTGETAWTSVEYKIGDEEKVIQFKNIHTDIIRQMSYELLKSPELFSFAKLRTPIKAEF
jgi:hypothetical protein